MTRFMNKLCQPQCHHLRSRLDEIRICEARYKDWNPRKCWKRDHYRLTAKTSVGELTKLNEDEPGHVTMIDLRALNVSSKGEPNLKPILRKRLWSTVVMSTVRWTTVTTFSFRMRWSMLRKNQNLKLKSSISMDKGTIKQIHIGRHVLTQCKRRVKTQDMIVIAFNKQSISSML